MPAKKKRGRKRKPRRAKPKLQSYLGQILLPFKRRKTYVSKLNVKKAQYGYTFDAKGRKRYWRLNPDSTVTRTSYAKIPKKITVPKQMLPPLPAPVIPRKALPARPRARKALPARPKTTWKALVKKYGVMKASKMYKKK